MIEALLKKGADVNALNKHGVKLIWDLMDKSYNFKTVRSVLNFGADVEARDEVGNTPLFDAIYFKNVKVGQLLIDYGASVNSVNIYGCTPLHHVQLLAIKKLSNFY